MTTSASRGGSAGTGAASPAGAGGAGTSPASVQRPIAIQALALTPRAGVAWDSVI